MLRMEVEPSTRMVLVYLDVAERQRLLEVLCDWLSRYAGIACAAPPIEEVCWILELRRLLLSPDEPRCVHGSEPHRGGNRQVEERVRQVLADQHLEHAQRRDAEDIVGQPGT